jgi:hypothetical protein
VQRNPKPYDAGEVRAAWRRYFSNGVVEWNIQLIAILCKEMGWTYEEYLSQPEWFILMLMELFRAEAAHANGKV